MLVQDPNASNNGGAKRFVDLVRLHTADRSIIYIDEEHELLRQGVTEFGLSLDEAQGMVYNTAHARGVALESQVDRYLTPFMQKIIKRGKISRREFKRLVETYQTMLSNRLSKVEAEKRVKAIVERRGLKPQRDWRRLLSRKWFNRIQSA